MPQQVTILGSTGSIGMNTLDVISRHGDKYKVRALGANTNVDLLYEQCLAFQPAFAVMADDDSAASLENRIKSAGVECTVLSSSSGLEQIASLPEIDTVVAAIVGAAGLLPTLSAVRSGKRILLANKEALVMSGKLFMSEVEKYKATLLPIDSEHNAIFQCLPDGGDVNNSRKGIRKILLTASGGPFRTTQLDQLKTVTPEQAVAHPNWNMGKKISVDSATMMNKGLEVIEAHWLFHVAGDRIEVVIHPQSIVHSMVSYVDGSVLAQLGNPDMRTPIAHALAWPERIDSGVEPLDVIDVATLDFEAPDVNRFPCLPLCFQSLESGGAATAVLNAANEIAVSAFLENKIAFTDIPEIIEFTLKELDSTNADTLEAIINADHLSRDVAQSMVSRKRVA